jgi:hypothetical protein
MHIERLTLWDFKCFEQTATPFVFDGGEELVARMTVLLGTNGAGKSSVLRAAAIAILAEVLTKSGYIPARNVRFGQGVATIAADVALDDGPQPSTFTGTIRRRGDHEDITAVVPDALVDDLYSDRSPALFLVGYGATRRVETAETFDPQALFNRRRARYQRVASLFEDQTTLIPLRSWLPRSERRFELLELLDRLLPPNLHVTVDAHDAVRVEQRDIDSVAGELSDAYRGYLAMVGDLLFHLDYVCPDDVPLDALPGVVLIDEVGLHLHPSWQRSVLQTLTEALPKVQFIVTTHSPIIAGTVYPANIRVMEDVDATTYGLEHATLISTFEESIHGRNAEQILTSPYFGLTTTRAPRAVEELHRLHRWDPCLKPLPKPRPLPENPHRLRRWDPCLSSYP